MAEGADDEERTAQEEVPSTNDDSCEDQEEKSLEGKQYASTVFDISSARQRERKTETLDHAMTHVPFPQMLMQALR